jgi:hypothetical protein
MMMPLACGSSVCLIPAQVCLSATFQHEFLLKAQVYRHCFFHTLDMRARPAIYTRSSKYKLLPHPTHARGFLTTTK